MDDQTAAQPGEIRPYIQSQRLDIYQKYIKQLLILDMHITVSVPKTDWIR